MEKQNKVLLIVIAIVVLGIIYLGLSLTKDVGKTSSTVNMENSIKKLDVLYKDIDVKTYNTQRGSSLELDDQIAILPDISEYPFVVNPTTDNFITIYSSTEKANEDQNSWLCAVANKFNSSNITVNGVNVSVGIRAISSNLAADFIKTGKYTPDVYMPSSTIYGKLIENQEKKYTLVSENMLNNVSGIIISNKVLESVKTKYKNSDVGTLINSVIEGNTIIGYTNPLSNEDGLNYLLLLLNTFDSSNPFSDKAINQLKAYQDKIPYVPYDITQLMESVQNGTIDGFASNYNVYYNSPELRKSCEFIPYGIPQTQPVYALDDISDIKSQILQSFLNYCKNADLQALATNNGFNAFKDYQYTGYQFNGNDVLNAQNIWKKEKNGSSDLTVVFVSDISGSMDGSPLLKLKASLNRASTFIDENTNIGLITFSDNVNIVLPIAKFDDVQKSYFLNAVKSMRASGGTAMFNAIVVAQHMLIEQQQKNPNTRLMMFVLTDGENNRGYEFEDIEEISKGLRIPIYTIGYNADIDVLETISDINEASTMDADSDNVIYKLESLFNSQM